MTDEADPLLEDLTRAAEFMDDVRAVQAASGKPVLGARRLTPFHLTAIAQAGSRSSIVRHVGDALDSGELQQILFERFEEMCRRRETPVPDSLRPSILKLLSLELYSNVHALGGGNLRSFLPVTVYQGACVYPMMHSEEFSEFTPSVFRNVAYGNATDPLAALRRAQTIISDFMQDEEFKEFRETPGIFQDLAIGNPKDPKAALRKIMGAVEDLAHDDEFEEFHESTSLLQRVAAHSRKDPRAALRKVQVAVAQLLVDDDLKDFRETPGVVRFAAIYYPTDPKSALQTVLTTISELRTEEEIKEFHPWILQKVAICNPSDPRGALRRVKATAARLANDPAFVEFRDSPYLFVEAAIRHLKNPDEALTNLQASAARLGLPDFPLKVAALR